MNAATKIEASGLDLLRAEFPPHQISKLPKPTKKDAPKGKCKPKSQGGDAPDWQDHFCGGYHGLPAVHLDYVGHAALTDRLLDCDPAWSWEPMGTTPEGLPVLSGGLWIKLTVCGVSRYGFGSADGKSGGDAIKEMIGDALRNAAMRFGAALELWHKGDLHVEEPEQDNAPPPAPEVSAKAKDGDLSPSALKAALRIIVHDINGCGDLRDLDAILEDPDRKPALEQCERRSPAWWETGEGMPAEFVPLSILIQRRRRELEEIETLNNRQRTVLDAG